MEIQVVISEGNYLLCKVFLWCYIDSWFVLIVCFDILCSCGLEVMWVKVVDLDLVVVVKMVGVQFVVDQVVVVIVVILLLYVQIYQDISIQMVVFYDQFVENCMVDSMLYVSVEVNVQQSLFNVMDVLSW